MTIPHNPPATSPQAKDRFRLGGLLPWLVLAVSLVATYLWWQSERQNVMHDLQLDFDFRVRETHFRIEDRMKAYEQILRGTRAMLQSPGNVSSREFDTYIESLHMEDYYPGSQGVGFAAYAARPGGDGGYAPIRLHRSFVGKRELTAGHDMYSDPVLRAAMELARDIGSVVNSGKVLLPMSTEDDPRIQSGFLMFLPVYRAGSPVATPEQRRRSLTGWVYVPFRMVDLMNGVLGEVATEVDIEIHDGEALTNETMMYDPDISGAGGNPRAIFKNTTRMQFGGRTWTVVIVSLPAFEESGENDKPEFVAYVGIQTSLLLTILAWLLVHSRARALRAAEELNRELAERRRAEEGLRLSDTVVRTVEEAVVVTDRDNLIVAANPAFTEITGYTEAEVIGKNPRMLSSGRHPKEFFREMWGTLLATGSWHGEVWDRRKDGEIYIKWLSIKLVRNEAGKVTHHVGVFSDISERKAAEERMHHLAHYDMLTDLPNRTLFSDRLQQELAHAKRNKRRLALMFIDLDKFKPINDTYGHAVGDMLLQEVAKRLQNCVRESDTVSRIGGDEFVVLLATVEAEQHAMLVAQKMLHVLGQPFVLAGQTLHVSGSIGIAVYPEHGSDERTLTHSADIAMYYAKSGGRNGARIYRSDMQDVSQ